MGLVSIGIDERIARILEDQGISKLYPPQEEAWDAIKGGRNTVVAIPTASGKSMIAYLAMLHRWLRTGQKSLYIVPLRALASEKFEDLQAFRSLGLKAAISTGDLDDVQSRKLAAADVIVCTSEKADALLRHRTGWVQDIGCVVSDEMHLLHDPNRGPTLEVILSRFRALLPDAQIIGLSATVANAQALANWLDAALIHSTWRPVVLRTGTYFGDALKFLDEEPQVLEAAGDPVASLVEQTIKDGGQCLVFVSTRRSAESQAVKLGGVVRNLLDPTQLAALEEASHTLEAGEATSAATKLKKLCTAGVAYHTAGLDARQRKFVENQFKAGKLKVLCATPTLAAGVNTPARRVIIRDLSRFEVGQGNRMLPVMEVQQMMGRAGRPRYDPHGEAILLVKNLDQRDAVEETYLRGPPENVTSKLGADAALRIHTLASIAGGYCTTDEELLTFLSGTFWAQETDDWIIRDRLEDVTWFLEENGFLELDGSTWRCTLFGKRTSDLYIDPFSALRLRTALESKQQPTTFGLLATICGCPDLYPLYLRRSDEWVQTRFWEHHEEMLVPEDGKDLESALSYAKTAFLLEDWMDEQPLQTLEERYQIGPGDIRMRVENAGWMLHAMRELARALDSPHATEIAALSQRLEHGVKGELLPLLLLKGIGRIRARTLYRAGFTSPKILQSATIARVAALPGFGTDSAKALLVQVGANMDQTGMEEPTAPAAPQENPKNAPAPPTATPPPAKADATPDKTKDQVSLHDF